MRRHDGALGVGDQDEREPIRDVADDVAGEDRLVDPRLDGDEVAELARQYEAGGGISFRGFLDELGAASQAEAAEAPILEESSDGVRLMTVHKAKGLEFPVVILADLTCRMSRGDASRYLDPSERLCAMKIGGWAPHALHDHEDDEVARDQAEGVRLAYVAATRARDLLVIPFVSLFFAVWGNDDEDAGLYIIPRPSEVEAPTVSPFNMREVHFFYPGYVTQRLVSQRGLFTVHPEPDKPYVADRMRQIVIGKECKGDFRRKLDSSGTHHAAIYADLDGLSRRLVALQGYRYESISKPAMIPVAPTNAAIVRWICACCSLAGMKNGRSRRAISIAIHNNKVTQRFTALEWRLRRDENVPA